MHAHHLAATVSIASAVASALQDSAAQAGLDAYALRSDEAIRMLVERCHRLEDSLVAERRARAEAETEADRLRWSIARVLKIADEHRG